MDLLKRRQAVLDNNARMEKTRGSGWHPADLGAIEREMRRELFLSDRPVVIQVDDRIHIVGNCIDRIKVQLQAFCDKVEAAPEDDLIGHGLQFQSTCIKMAKRALEQVGDEMILPTMYWNYCLFCLTAQGMQVVITDLKG